MRTRARTELWFRKTYPGDRGRGEKITTVLTYTASDPFAVTMTFTGGADAPVWVIDRGLLAAGLNGPSGIGDVRVRPARNGFLVVSLRSPDGSALLSAERAAVAAFLAATYRVVPAGRESALLNVDECCALLLEEGGADHG